MDDLPINIPPGSSLSSPKFGVNPYYSLFPRQEPEAITKSTRGKFVDRFDRIDSISLIFKGEQLYNLPPGYWQHGPAQIYIYDTPDGEILGELV